MTRLVTGLLHRAGATSNKWDIGSNKLDLRCDGNHVYISTDVSSAGGGRTDLLLDFPLSELLRVLAIEIETDDEKKDRKTLEAMRLEEP